MPTLSSSDVPAVGLSEALRIAEARESGSELVGVSAAEAVSVFPFIGAVSKADAATLGGLWEAFTLLQGGGNISAAEALASGAWEAYRISQTQGGEPVWSVGFADGATVSVTGVGATTIAKSETIAAGLSDLPLITLVAPLLAVDTSAAGLSDDGPSVILLDDTAGLNPIGLAETTAIATVTATADACRSGLSETFGTNTSIIPIGSADICAVHSLESYFMPAVPGTETYAAAESMAAGLQDLPSILEQGMDWSDTARVGLVDVALVLVTPILAEFSPIGNVDQESDARAVSVPDAGSVGAAEVQAVYTFPAQALTSTDASLTGTVEISSAAVAAASVESDRMGLTESTSSVVQAVQSDDTSRAGLSEASTHALAVGPVDVVTVGQAEAITFGNVAIGSVDVLPAGVADGSTNQRGSVRDESMSASVTERATSVVNPGPLDQVPLRIVESAFFAPVSLASTDTSRVGVADTAGSSGVATNIQIGAVINATLVADFPARTVASQMATYELESQMPDYTLEVFDIAGDGA